MGKIKFNEFLKEGAKKQKAHDGMDFIRRRLNKKSPLKRRYGTVESLSVDNSYNYDSIIQEILASATPFVGREYINSSQYNMNNYEEDAEELNKKDIAASIFKQLYPRKDLSREDIIQAIEDRTGVSNSTAIAYYQRLAKAAGVAGKKRDEIEDDPFKSNSSSNNNQSMSGQDENGVVEEPDNDLEGEEKTPEDAIIRTVKNAHLISKIQDEDGRFVELWIYNVDKNMRDAIKIRRDILAGTDIPMDKTQSEDGNQTYSVWTLGNAQILQVKGLPN